MCISGAALSVPCCSDHAPLPGLQGTQPGAHGTCRTQSISLGHSSILFQGIKLPETLRASGDLDAVVAHGQLLLMVVPTPFVASTMSAIRDKLRPEQARQPIAQALSSLTSPSALERMAVATRSGLSRHDRLHEDLLGTSTEGEDEDSPDHVNVKRPGGWGLAHALSM